MGKMGRVLNLVCCSLIFLSVSPCIAKNKKPALPKCEEPKNTDTDYEQIFKTFEGIEDNLNIAYNDIPKCSPTSSFLGIGPTASDIQKSFRSARVNLPLLREKLGEISKISKQNVNDIPPIAISANDKGNCEAFNSQLDYYAKLIEKYTEHQSVLKDYLNIYSRGIVDIRNGGIPTEIKKYEEQCPNDNNRGGWYCAAFKTKNPLLEALVPSRPDKSEYKNCSYQGGTTTYIEVIGITVSDPNEWVYRYGAPTSWGMSTAKQYQKLPIPAYHGGQLQQVKDQIAALENDLEFNKSVFSCQSKNLEFLLKDCNGSHGVPSQPSVVVPSTDPPQTSPPHPSGSTGVPAKQAPPLTPSTSTAEITDPNYSPTPVKESEFPQNPPPVDESLAGYQNPGIAGKTKYSGVAPGDSASPAAPASAVPPSGAAPLPDSLPPAPTVPEATVPSTNLPATIPATVPPVTSVPPNPGPKYRNELDCFNHQFTDISQFHAFCCTSGKEGGFAGWCNRIRKQNYGCAQNYCGGN